MTTLVDDNNSNAKIKYHYDYFLKKKTQRITINTTVELKLLTRLKTDET